MFTPGQPTQQHSRPCSAATGGNPSHLGDMWSPAVALPGQYTLTRRNSCTASSSRSSSAGRARTQGYSEPGGGFKNANSSSRRGSSSQDDSSSSSSSRRPKGPALTPDVPGLRRMSYMGVYEDTFRGERGAKNSRGAVGAVSGVYPTATAGPGDMDSSCCYTGGNSTLSRSRNSSSSYCGPRSSPGTARVATSTAGGVVPGYLAAYAGSSSSCSGRGSSGLRRISAQDCGSGGALSLMCCGVSSNSSSSKPGRVGSNGLQGHLVLQQQQRAATAEWRSRRRSVDQLLQQLVTGHAAGGSAGAAGCGIAKGVAGGVSCGLGAGASSGVGAGKLQTRKHSAGATAAGGGAYIDAGSGDGGSRIVLRSCSMPDSNAAAAAALVATISGQRWEKLGGVGN
jgi:hypothetical protein